MHGERVSLDIVSKSLHLCMLVMIARQRYVTRNGAISSPTWKKCDSSTESIFDFSKRNVRTCRVSLKSHWLQTRWFTAVTQLHDHACQIHKLSTCVPAYGMSLGRWNDLGWTRQHSSCWVWNSCRTVMVCANGARTRALET